MSNAPVALFVYRRPEHTRATVEALLRNPESAQTDLHVFSDGAREAGSEEAVKQVRRYVREITGMRSIAVVERDHGAEIAREVRPPKAT